MENSKCCSVDFVEEEHHDDDGHDHDHGSAEGWALYAPGGISFVLLTSGLLLKYIFKAAFFESTVEIVWFALAYIPVALPVLREALESLRKGDLFTEFFLMSVATIGAFAIGEYPEGVAVMLFYAVGELFQNAAIQRSKSNIKALLDVRPKLASVFRNEGYQIVVPAEVQIGEKIQVKVGEKVPLDSVLLSPKASFNTAAITGESKPMASKTGDQVLAASINLEGVVELRVSKLFNDSSVAKILDLVQNATSRKSKTELLIRRLAKVYTPIVVYLAIAICFLPYFFVEDYVFRTWLYRSLIFLVISCPCALVISIPLGYFGGLGAASQNGLLFKGANYLDQLTKVTTLVMDKTGTVTRGIFEIQEIVIEDQESEGDFMKKLASLEAMSNHPIAKAILEYPIESELFEVEEVREIAGKGLRGKVEGSWILAGNARLMEHFEIPFPDSVKDIVDTIVLVAMDGKYAGYVTIADELKEDAKAFISELKKAGINELVMLSGDKDTITQKVAKSLGIEKAKGGLLPEDKLSEVEALQKEGKLVAFIGDGINDAPVLAASDIGIAMGAMGSDVAIETADLIIQTDEPSKVLTGLKIATSTQAIIWQNIYLAFGVKIAVLTLGAFGMATMWEAVFADVGVAFLAILNAVRLQRMRWS